MPCSSFDSAGQSRQTGATTLFLAGYFAFPLCYQQHFCLDASASVYLGGLVYVFAELANRIYHFTLKQFSIVSVVTIRRLIGFFALFSSRIIFIIISIIIFSCSRGPFMLRHSHESDTLTHFPPFGGVFFYQNHFNALPPSLLVSAFWAYLNRYCLHATALLRSIRYW